MSMKSIPSSRARRRVRIASGRSAGSPQIPGPVRRMAPKPRRWMGELATELESPGLRRLGLAHAILRMGTERRSGPA